MTYRAHKASGNVFHIRDAITEHSNGFEYLRTYSLAVCIYILTYILLSFSFFFIYPSFKSKTIYTRKMYIYVQK